MIAILVCSFVEVARPWPQGFAFPQLPVDPPPFPPPPEIPVSLPAEVETFLPVLSNRNQNDKEDSVNNQNFMESENARDEVADTTYAVEEFSQSINDFTQDLLREVNEVKCESSLLVNI